MVSSIHAKILLKEGGFFVNKFEKSPNNVPLRIILRDLKGPQKLLDHYSGQKKSEQYLNVLLQIAEQK